jgi:protein involved in ribonucleotide reduction
MLDIVYFSNVSNNTQRFVDKLHWEGRVHRIPVKGEFDLALLNSYVLVCPSYGDANHGHVPVQVRKFLKDELNRSRCVGVIGTGNINFGEEYAMAGPVLSHKLKVPLLYQLELAGTDDDVLKVRRGLECFGVAGGYNSTIQKLNEKQN